MTTLDETLQQKLAEWRPHSSRQVLEVDHPASGWKAAVSAEHADLVGVRLWELRLNRTGPPPGDTLRQRAERIAGRVTGLLEPLRLVEVDLDRSVAQLRSTAPSARGAERSYYEVLLQGDGTTTVRRFRSASAAREQIAFSLTHEAIAKLVADLTA
jgi:hypothetical protein